MFGGAVRATNGWAGLCPAHATSTAKFVVMLVSVFFVAVEQRDVGFFDLGKLIFHVVADRHVPVIALERQPQILAFERVAMAGKNQVADDADMRLGQVFDIFAL